MNKNSTLSPKALEGVKDIEGLKYILALTEAEKRELLRLWKERNRHGTLAEQLEKWASGGVKPSISFYAKKLEKRHGRKFNKNSTTL